MLGLSPPTRGSLHFLVLLVSGHGSIPAHTGKPTPTPAAEPTAEVYPRPHGEANIATTARYSCRGLSPPTRGSRVLLRLWRHRRRSIPAHTGKPCRGGRRWPSSWVYPRPHGEARSFGRRRRPSSGLSPPTRGSPSFRLAPSASQGSIPAHTGKPVRPLRDPGRSGVYPRPHGEAVHGATGGVPKHGLSPPTRGSPLAETKDLARLGSIPAHTGKPSCSSQTEHSSGVYPRPHGEASFDVSRDFGPWGLSPPTRGSPVAPSTEHDMTRSIPAHTGKPGRTWRRRRLPAVYPRPHGEAGKLNMGRQAARGLSPPTRGSRCSLLFPPPIGRSIPAHTGKPARPTGAALLPRVYPRPHGEAGIRARNAERPPGLSPPTRGSQLGQGLHGLPRRSIPAHTGKPGEFSVTELCS